MMQDKACWITSLVNIVCDDRGIRFNRPWSNDSHLGVMRA